MTEGYNGDWTQARGLSVMNHVHESHCFSLDPMRDASLAFAIVNQCKQDYVHLGIFKLVAVIECSSPFQIINSYVHDLTAKEDVLNLNVENHEIKHKNTFLST